MVGCFVSPDGVQGGIATIVRYYAADGSGVVIERGNADDGGLDGWTECTGAPGEPCECGCNTGAAERCD